MFTDRRHFKPFALLNILFVFMLFSGKFAIEMYAVEIFRQTQDTMDGNIATIILGNWSAHLFNSQFLFIFQVLLILLDQ